VPDERLIVQDEYGRWGRGGIWMHEAAYVR
jgi:hypothetical protein